MYKSDKSEEALWEAMLLDRQLRDPIMPPSCYWVGRNWWSPDIHPAHHWYKMPTAYECPTKADIAYVNPEGKIHRTTGPAYISKRYDYEIWVQNDVIHRVGGWAFRHKRNYAWYENGVLHNLHGPAIIDAGGPKQYWILGSRVSPTEWKKEVERRKRKGLLNGKGYNSDINERDRS